ncbi:TIGR04255 family protein [Candidatus Aerophobetes bacterium]|nr:TIGR04255 family protein [Candidatus Aerophobetes bacterium]
MTRKILKNKPILEAIFELRWKLQEYVSRIKTDPHYKLIIGRLYDKLKDEYPFHEQLSAAALPDEIAGYLVQHRFRKDKGKWPLVQIGPGIITVNDTKGYAWEDFKGRIAQTVNTLFEVYPESKNSLEVNRLLLRYIDGITFNFQKNNLFDFLEKQMKTKINLYQHLFEDTGVEKLPLALDLKFSFASKEPKGAINLRFVRGKIKESDALIWETIVESIPEDTPKDQNRITRWVEKAHSLADDWFFKLIEGELLRRFE